MMASSAADLKFLHRPAASSFRNFKSKSGTRIIKLLVPLCFRSSCQRVPRCITNFGSGALAAEWIQKLRAETFRERRVGDTILIGQHLRRHVTGAEHHIQDRKRRGEVLRSAALRRGMVPAMKNRTGNDVFE